MVDELFVMVSVLLLIATGDIVVCGAFVISGLPIVMDELSMVLVLLLVVSSGIVVCAGSVF